MSGDITPYQWRPGQSGNPGGKPKMPEEIKRALQGRTLDAIEKLWKLTSSDDERIRLMATVKWLELARVQDMVSAEDIGGGDFIRMPSKELAQRALHVLRTEMERAEEAEVVDG